MFAVRDIPIDSPPSLRVLAKSEDCVWHFEPNHRGCSKGQVDWPQHLGIKWYSAESTSFNELVLRAESLAEDDGSPLGAGVVVGVADVIDLATFVVVEGDGAAFVGELAGIGRQHRLMGLA